MKRLFVNRNIIVSIFVVILLIYGVQGMSYGQDVPDTVVQFSDRTLAIMVRIDIAIQNLDPPNLSELLEMPEAEVLKIPKAELTKLTRLSASTDGTDDLELPLINDLTGLEHATQLRSLYLSGQNVIDLTPLSGCSSIGTAIQTRCP